MLTKLGYLRIYGIADLGFLRCCRFFKRFSLKPILVLKRFCCLYSQYPDLEVFDNLETIVIVWFETCHDWILYAALGWNWLKRWRNNPVGIYLFKVNNRITRTMCEICSKLSIKTLEWRHPGVFNLNFKQFSHIVLVFSWMTLNK